MTVYGHAFWAWYPFRRKPWVRPLLLGAILPDAPYLIGFALTVVVRGPRSLADLALWDSLWRSPAVCALHSFVPWALAVLGAAAFDRRMGRHRAPREARSLARRLVPDRATTVAFLGGWGAHVVIDMLTHRSDGYPIFWPLSGYRFPTPVSYWEPDHHGVLFTVLSDGGMALAIASLVWRRLRLRRASEVRS